VTRAEPGLARVRGDGEQHDRTGPAQGVRGDQRRRALRRTVRGERGHLQRDDADERHHAVGAVAAVLHDRQPLRAVPPAAEPVGHVREAVVVERAREQRADRGRERGGREGVQDLARADPHRGDDRAEDDTHRREPRHRAGAVGRGVVADGDAREEDPRRAQAAHPVLIRRTTTTRRTWARR
jgi:hypothetical protein